MLVSHWVATTKDIASKCSRKNCFQYSVRGFVEPAQGMRVIDPLSARRKDLFLLLQLRVLDFGLLQDGDVGIGVFPEGEESSGGLRYCGSPTFRTSSANRGSERMGSSGKSAFKPTSSRSCS